MVAKTKYSLKTEKYLARNENKPFWQQFGKPIQFHVLLDPVAAKTRYSVEAEKCLARCENEAFWQEFGKLIQFQICLDFL